MCLKKNLVHVDCMNKAWLTNSLSKRSDISQWHSFNIFHIHIPSFWLRCPWDFLVDALNWALPVLYLLTPSLFLLIAVLVHPLNRLGQLFLQLILHVIKRIGYSLYLTLSISFILIKLLRFTYDLLKTSGLLYGYT